MRIKIRFWIFLLFGVQGVLQVIYWELIKGYPACFMCKGYRVLYVSILLTTILYRKRASFFRLLLLCGLVAIETFWSVWDVIQKMGVVTQKCNATAQIIEEKMVFVACSAKFYSWGKGLRSPVGLNALLSVMMLGYVVWIVWKIKPLHRKYFRWCLVLIGLWAHENIASTHKDAYAAIQQVVSAQHSKRYESDAQGLCDVSEGKAKKYEAQARQLGTPLAKTVLTEAQAIVDEDCSAAANKGACKGKCPSFQPTSDMEPSLQVCMSFSVPLQVWKELNDDLAKHHGVFVIKGLPNNSFQAFAGKVLEFRKQGITAPIRIDPKLFDRLKVNQVPLFVVKKQDETHTVSGTVTIPYVMDLMHIKKEEKQ